MKLMGHRGARDRALENTIESFEHLLKSNTSCFEFDIHQLKSGEFVVHHDDTLDRTTTAKGPIAIHTWDEISNFKTIEGTQIPRLEDVLSLIANTECELQIELKNNCNLEQLKKVLVNSKSVHNFTVISFNHRWLLGLKEIFPEIKTAPLLFGLPIDPISIITSTKANGISLSINLLDKQLVDECHLHNFTVTTWNANNYETFIKAKSTGVDYIGTDVPYTAVTWL